MVIFQSEIRQVLERMSPLRFFLGRPEALDRVVLEEVVRAAFDLAQKRVGALIVFQRHDLLEAHLKGGIPLDGRMSYEVLSSIFLPGSPAHDGAVIIHEGRILAMGCYLPLSDNPALPRNYGTRHRAGIGITERSDALAVIVSEERGEVVLAVQSEALRMFRPEQLQERLNAMLIRPEASRGRWQTSLTSNLAPKVISLALVLFLWSFVAGHQRAEIRLTVPLEYRNIPTHMEIAGDTTSKVEVGIRGSRGIIFGVTPDQVRAYVDLTRAIAGQNYIRLTLDNISAPPGTEVTKISPSAVRLHLETVATRSVPVRVHFVGKLAHPLRLKAVRVDPPAVLLQGPVKSLGRIREVDTKPVDLAGIREDQKMSVGLEVLAPQVRLAPSQPDQVAVEVQVEGGR